MHRPLTLTKVEWLRQVVKSCKPYFSYLKNKKKWELFCASDLKLKKIRGWGNLIV